MRRNPMVALDDKREALVREQLEEAWIDIERTLDAADPPPAAARPARPTPLRLPIEAAPPRRRARRWRSWTLAAAATLLSAALAFHFLASGR